MLETEIISLLIAYWNDISYKLDYTDIILKWKSPFFLFFFFGDAQGLLVDVLREPHEVSGIEGWMQGKCITHYAISIVSGFSFNAPTKKFAITHEKSHVGLILHFLWMGLL